ncbi:hypothetical protein TUMSATVNIG3_56570 (plasmid) [Vibrio nigripulchritudo]|nr:hypothetical protein TUMSATVNIG2_55880 [Vibrio nigripulchritudo]BDU46859.1 hypothetical protein TUMSATVNIG3_56570 [Vibrio nigripulchritudo]
MLLAVFIFVIVINKTCFHGDKCEIDYTTTTDFAHSCTAVIDRDDNDGIDINRNQSTDG